MRTRRQDLLKLDLFQKVEILIRSDLIKKFAPHPSEIGATTPLLASQHAKIDADSLQNLDQ